MQITPAASLTPQPGPPAWFAGAVTLQPLFAAAAPGRVQGARVTFAPGARTAWHSHPAGQVLLITDGTGRVQCRGGPVQTVQPGDVVVIPAGEVHWHGAAPDRAMTHLAIHEAVDGITATWLDHVTD